MAMFHVVVSQSGPEFDPAKPLEQQSRWDEHAGFMDGLVDAGFLVLGGPIGETGRVIHAVEAESEEAVRDTFGQDPWAGSHLVVESVEPWTIRLDARERRS